MVMRNRFASVLILFATSIASVAAIAEVRPTIGTKTGEMYPDFVLPTLNGEVKRLSDYRGKRILLFHFASW